MPTTRPRRTRNALTKGATDPDFGKDMPAVGSADITVSPLTAKDIVRCITKRHARKRGARTDNWAIFPELRVGTGYARNSVTADVESRIDLLAFPLWPGSGDGVTVYEIKISRSDFLHEIKHPLKRRPALRYSNLFYFVTPKGLLRSAEVPVECGLLEVDETGRTQVIVPAPYRNDFHPTTTFVASICRRVLGIASGELE